jgi:hypothetical protein
MEAQGMWRYTSHLTAALGGGEWSASVDGRISPDNKAPETNGEYSQGGLQSWSGSFVEGINFLTQSGTEPRSLECSIRRQVTTLTVLYRLPRRENNNKMDLRGTTWHGERCIHLVQDTVNVRHLRTMQWVFVCQQTRRIFRLLQLLKEDITPCSYLSMAVQVLKIFTDIYYTVLQCC